MVRSCSSLHLCIVHSSNFSLFSLPTTSSSTAVAPLASTSTSHQSAVIPKDGGRDARYSASNPSGTVPSSVPSSIVQTGLLEGARIADKVTSAALASSATFVGSSSVSHSQPQSQYLQGVLTSAAQPSFATGHSVHVPGEESKTQPRSDQPILLHQLAHPEVAPAAQSSSTTGHPVFVPGEESKLDAFRPPGTREGEHQLHSHQCYHHYHHHYHHHFHYQERSFITLLLFGKRPDFEAWGF